MPNDHAVYFNRVAASLSFARLAALLPLLLLFGALGACGPNAQDAAQDAALAQSLLQERRIGEARIAIERAIAADDSEAAYYLIRGRIEFAAGSIDNAFSAYDYARALDPSSMEALQAVSQLGLQTGELRASLEATDAVLALDPDDVEILTTRGLHSVIQRKYDEAEGYADRILALDPTSEGGTILKVRVMFLGGDSTGALALLDRFAAQNEATASIALTRLEVQRARRDAAGLASEFAALRTLAPDNPGLRIDEANFAFKTGRKAEGVALTASRLADPDTTIDIARTAIALWDEYAVRKVPQTGLNAIAQNAAPGNLRLVGEYLARDGQLSAARQMVDRLTGADRDALAALIALEGGDRKLALRLSESVLESDSSHCTAFIVRARGLVALDQPRAGLRPAQEAASQCPNTQDAWIMAARAYTALGDKENARRVWRQGIDANPQATTITKQYVDWLLKFGRTQEAVTVARRLTLNAPALLSGWRLYDATCRKTGNRCVGEAGRGLADARTRYGVDLLPGEAPPNGLFGRLSER